MAGAGLKSPPPAALEQSIFSTVISVVSLMIVFHINRWSVDSLQDAEYLLGSFGASSVLVYHAIESPMAQPMNLVFGHTRVSIAKIVPQSLMWAGAPAAVGLAIFVMALTNTTHPPGGATALIAVIGSDHMRSLGYYYVVQPALSGALVMLICAVVFNNLHPRRQYPVHWINQFYWW
ncbi:hypothetical protein HK101_002911 [Irineochytrium annulatum]|nr:hypothetical protein HK101_002911 [Irineochytrium annulatum]